MAIISSHVLDSVIGDHAGGIRIGFYRSGGESGRAKLFDIIANEEGRIAETVEVENADGEYELVFHSAEYFAAQPAMPTSRQIVKTVVVRFEIPDPNGRVHIPVMLSPHSYSTWWSG